MTTHPEADLPADYLDQRLERDWAQQEQALQDIIRTFDTQEYIVCVEAWNGFEDVLLRHFEFEECHLFPALQRDLPVLATLFADEHAGLLQELQRLGLGLDLHITKAEDVRQFVRALRKHSIREHKWLHEWLQSKFRSEVHAGLKC
jgi:hypothetical protein